MNRFITKVVLISALVSVGAVAALAQTGGGATLVGTVKDGTGAAVAGAKVTVVNTATNFTTENITSAEGAYYIPYLVPGEYRVKVTAAGFKEIVREGITLRSAEVPRIDINLEVGALSESVTVNASASLLLKISTAALPSLLTMAGGVFAGANSDTQLTM